MIQPPARPISEEDKQRERERRRLLGAYIAVFGSSEATRTDAQRLVMTDMESRAYFYRTTLVAASKDGHSDDQFNASAEGQRLFMLNTIALIRAGAATFLSDNEETNARKKPKRT